MKTIINIGLVFVCLMSISVVSAQQLQGTLSSKLVESGECLDEQLGKLDDGVFLQQVGINNQAFIYQYSMLNGDNLASIWQMGISETAILNQMGNNHLADFYQLGANNLIDVTEYGNSISSRIFQIGIGNRVHQELAASGRDFTIIQMGNQHEVTNLGFNPVQPGYTIRQSGLTGMKITIQHH